MIFIILLALILRLYRLDMLPADLWGDINEHYELALKILNGNFFYHYNFGGDGPLISYLIAVTAKIFGLSFYTIKLTTVIVGALSTFILYYLALELFKKKEIALISSFLMSISFWSISLSRQGKPYILVPLFVMLTVLFLLEKRKILAGIFLGLGMYTQTSFWGIMIFSFFNPLTFITSLIISSPFLYSFISNMNYYLNSHAYLGEKLGMDLSLTEKISRFAENIAKNAMSFNFTGDSVFRHNISGNSHLDFVSGIFFVAGLLMILFKTIKEKDKKLLAYFFLPFIFAQLTSLLDINNPANVPNLGRMSGAMPFVLMAVAYAMHRLLLKKRIVLSLFLLIILYLNYRNYFIIYPQGLPNDNTPFSRIIAGKIDKYPSNILVGLVGCCWDEGGQPEWTSIEHALKNKRKLVVYNQGNDSLKLTCQSIKENSNKVNFVLITNPKDVYSRNLLKSCFNNLKIIELKQARWNIAYIVEGNL